MTSINELSEAFFRHNCLIEAMSERTVLYSRHVALGAKMFEFGGWEMPLWYTSIGDEHLTVRGGVGVFDASHMGKIIVDGDDACRDLERLLTRTVSKYPPGKCVYAHLLDDAGMIIDDLIVTVVSQTRCFVVCNASTRPKVMDWITKRGEGLEFTDVTRNYSCLAVQGPKAPELMGRIADKSLLLLKRYRGVMTDLVFPGNPLKGRGSAGFAAPISLLPRRNEGVNSFISRTGYTGEDGFEIFAPSVDTGFVWDQLLETGRDLGIKPIGLGARDTLRLEMCYLLSGHDFDGSQTPLQADAEFVIDWDHDFIGKKPLEEQKKGDYSRLVAFMSVGKGIPRDGYPLQSESGERIGKSTSGTMSPSLKVGIGMGYVPSAYSRPDTKISYEVGSRRVEAKVVAKPFIKR